MSEDTVESTYHHDLGKALFEIWSENTDHTEIETSCFLIGDELVIQDCVDLVQLGHWMSEALSTVATKHLEKGE